MLSARPEGPMLERGPRVGMGSWGGEASPSPPSRGSGGAL